MCSNTLQNQTLLLIHKAAIHLKNHWSTIFCIVLYGIREQISCLQEIIHCGALVVSFSEWGRHFYDLWALTPLPLNQPPPVALFMEPVGKGSCKYRYSLMGRFETRPQWRHSPLACIHPLRSIVQPPPA
jgi:hypothetical protein